MTFEQLPIGAMFRFYVGGSLLQKSGPKSYDAPTWEQKNIPIINPDQKVLPMRQTETNAHQWARRIV